ncbi:hypothetical protein, partial [Microseira wollei]|uniref:hypothetical protein n=1 Tax=Microseira wollei TaxID=467598 RepID=UPI001CFEDE79
RSKPSDNCGGNHSRCRDTAAKFSGIMKNLQIAVSRQCKISPLLTDQNPATIVVETIPDVGTRQPNFLEL